MNSRILGLVVILVVILIALSQCGHSAYAQGAPPTASFTVSCQGTTQCNFDASASSGSAPLKWYQWCWGDYTNCGLPPGAIRAGWGPWPPGDYAIGLVVTDENGLTGRTNRTFTVSSSAAPTATPARSATPTATPRPVTPTLTATLLPTPLVCPITLDSAQVTVPANGVSGALMGVSIPGGCSWTATPNVPWLVTGVVTVPIGAMLAYSADPNPGSQGRSGTIRIASLDSVGSTADLTVIELGTATVTVVAVTPTPGPSRTPTPTMTPLPTPAYGCPMLIIQGDATVNWTGLEVGTVQVVTPDGCPWTAAAIGRFVQLRDAIPGASIPVSGIGDGMIAYTVDRNAAGVERQGAILFTSGSDGSWDQVYVVRQANNVP